LLLFSVLYGFWAVNFLAFNWDVLRELAMQFLALAEKQRATVPLMIGHRVMGTSLLLTGNITAGRAHYDEGIALYNPTSHRSLATRFGQDVGVAILSYRSLALWLLGYSNAALKDANSALEYARESSHASALMYALNHVAWSNVWRGNYSIARLQIDESIRLADEKGALLWKADAKIFRGCIFTLTGEPSNGIQITNAGITAYRSTGATVWTAPCSPILAKAYAELGQFDDAWRCIDEAMTAIQTSKERWCEAEIHRTAGEIALASSSQLDAREAEAHFERALAVACAQ
jgi:tetratricopeptide (TPR) repeat protein